MSWQTHRVPLPFAFLVSLRIICRVRWQRMFGRALYFYAFQEANGTLLGDAAAHGVGEFHKHGIHVRPLHRYILTNRVGMLLSANDANVTGARVTFAFVLEIDNAVPIDFEND